MTECLKITNICILIPLTALYISSIISEIIYLVNNKENITFTFYIILIDLILTTITVLNVFLLGFPSLCFLSIDKLVTYSTINIFIILEKIFSFIILFLKENINLDYNLINIIFYIFSIQIILSIINIILCFVLRRKLIQEIKESPLNYVDEYMTEDMYTSILKQSLNPENYELKIDFQKKLELRKNESSRFSSTNSLKSSLKSKE